MKYIQFFLYYSLITTSHLWPMEEDVCAINPNPIILAYSNIVTNICKHSDLRTINSLLLCCKDYHNIYEQIPINLKTKEQLQNLQFGIDRLLLENIEICKSFKTYEYINTLVNYAQKRNQKMFQHIITHEEASKTKKRDAILNFFEYKSSEKSNIIYIMRAFKGRKKNKQVIERDDLEKAMINKEKHIFRIFILNNVYSSRSDQGSNALHCVAKMGLPQLAPLAISRTRNINGQNKKKQTALHVAAIKNLHGMVQLLIDNNINVNIQDNQNKYAIENAIDKKNTRIILILYKRLPRRFEVAKWNILHLLARHSCAHKAYLALKKYLQLDDLINATGFNNWTPLHMAALNNRIEFTELLLKENANINALTNQGNTALHVAAATDNKKIIALLVENEADSSIKNKAGHTALDYLFKKPLSSNGEVNWNLF